MKLQSQKLVGSHGHSATDLWPQLLLPHLDENFLGCITPKIDFPTYIHRNSSYPIYKKKFVGDKTQKIDFSSYHPPVLQIQGKRTCTTKKIHE
jgi:hypothetical protein